jgi:hypothetical protein
MPAFFKSLAVSAAELSTAISNGRSLPVLHSAKASFAAHTANAHKRALASKMQRIYIKILLPFFIIKPPKQVFTLILHGF